MGSVPVFLLLFAATHLVHSADPRAELRGRVVDAASGKPLEGAVVVASWIAEPAPNPLVVIIGLTVGGHGPGSRLRLGRVAETQSAADGTFVFPAWTHADQINSGMIVDGSRAVMAFLPGYAPRRWSADEAARGVLELRRYGSGPDGAVASLTSFRSWLAANVTSADPEGVGRSEEQVLVMPGQRRDESYEEKQARLAQQTAIRMVREELARLDPQADKDLSSMRQSVLDAPQLARIEKIEVIRSAPQSMAVAPGSARVFDFPPATPPELDAQRAFQSGDRRYIVLPSCWGGREIMPGWPSEEAHGYYTARTSGRVISCDGVGYRAPEPAYARAASYAAAYNRALLELESKGASVRP